MKKLLLIALLAVSLSASTTLEAPQPLAPLAGDDRAAVVQYLRKMYYGSLFFAEYYAYGQADFAFFYGRADAYAAAADYLESYVAPKPSK